MGDRGPSRRWSPRSGQSEASSVRPAEISAHAETFAGGLNPFFRPTRSASSDLTIILGRKMFYIQTHRTISVPDEEIHRSRERLMVFPITPKALNLIKLRPYHAFGWWLARLWPSSNQKRPICRIRQEMEPAPVYRSPRRSTLRKLGMDNQQRNKLKSYG